MGRKPILSERGDGVRPWQVKLFDHQIEWLKSHDNANAALREIIEDAMKRAEQRERRPRRRKA